MRLRSDEADDDRLVLASLATKDSGSRGRRKGLGPKGVGELDGYRLPLSGSASSSCNLPPPSEPRPRGQGRSLGDFMNILFVEVARGCTRSLRTRRYLGSVNIFSVPLPRPPTTTHPPPPSPPRPSNGEGIIYEGIVKVEQIAKEDFAQR